MTRTIPTPEMPGKTSGQTAAPPMDLLRREVRYRLSYRGTLELDSICRAAIPHIETLDEATLVALRDFLLHPEGRLMDWLVDGVIPPDEVQPMVQTLRGWFAAR